MKNLELYINETRKQIESLESQIAQVKNDIEQMYSTLCNIPYHLHAICVHDGGADSGHYFTFIKDHYQGIWRKFNDIRVTTVSEEEVMEQSIGGFGAMTAYWLVYISEERFNEYKTINVNSYDPTGNVHNTQTHTYGQIVAEDVSRQIDEENNNLIALIKEHKNLVIAKQVTAIYEARYNEILKLFPEKPDPATEYASIYTYIWARNSKETVQRLMLAFALREVCSGEHDQELLDKIEQQL